MYFLTESNDGAEKFTSRVSKPTNSNSRNALVFENIVEFHLQLCQAIMYTAQYIVYTTT